MGCDALYWSDFTSNHPTRQIDLERNRFPVALRIVWVDEWPLLFIGAKSIMKGRIKFGMGVQDLGAPNKLI